MFVQWICYNKISAFKRYSRRPCLVSGTSSRRRFAPEQADASGWPPSRVDRRRVATGYPYPIWSTTSTRALRSPTRRKTDRRRTQSGGRGTTWRWIPTHYRGRWRIASPAACQLSPAARWRSRTPRRVTSAGKSRQKRRARATSWPKRSWELTNMFNTNEKHILLFIAKH